MRRQCPDRYTGLWSGDVVVTIPEKGVHVNMVGPARLFAPPLQYVRKAAGLAAAATLRTEELR